MSREMTFFSDIEKHIAYQSTYVMTGINFTKKDDGWLCILKVRSKREGDLVTFIHAHSPEECLQVIWSALTTSSFTLKWKQDKYKK